MGDLSKNFSRAEFACRHCGDLKLHMPLIEALQALRDALGVPVIVNSGYRCSAHNRAIGGSPRSRHVYGQAADIRVTNMTPAQVAEIAETIPAFRGGGIGIYESFVHVDVRPYRARWEG